MNKFMRKLLASTLSAAMVLGSAMTAFAADTTTLPSGDQSVSTGEGKLEGYVTLDVTKVVLPTSWTTDFTLDPQGLLNVANSSKYTATGGAVYFANNGGTYSNTSDELQIINKSSYDVDVTLKVGVTASGTALSQINLVTSGALTSETSPAVYLGVVTSKAGITTTTAITADANSVQESADKVPEVDGSTYTQGYELKATQSSAGVPSGTAISPNGYYYYYDLTSGYVPGADQTIGFQLTGATNIVEGWGNVTEDVVANITYSIVKHSDGPSISMTSGGLITVTGLTAEQNFSTLYVAGGTVNLNAAVSDVTWNTASWSATDGGSFTAQLPANWISYWNGERVTATLTLSDGSTQTATAVF